MDDTVEKAGKEKKIEFGFTTNLTLVTREMAEYFASLDFCCGTSHFLLRKCNIYSGDYTVLSAPKSPAEQDHPD